MATTAPRERDIMITQVHLHQNNIDQQQDQLHQQDGGGKFIFKRCLFGLFTFFVVSGSISLVPVLFPFWDPYVNVNGADAGGKSKPGWDGYLKNAGQNFKLMNLFDDNIE